MTISGNVPEHLVVGARTNFLAAMPKIQLPWQKITSTINLDAKSIELVDIGAAPMPVESKGKTEVQDFIEKALAINSKPWEITIGLSYNALKDDLTGNLDRKARSAAENFQRHINNLAFKTLNGGDGSTYGLCYDGLNFFSNSHVDKGADYQTVQDNLYGLALTLDNFETVKVAADNFLDDRGEAMGLDYSLLVVSPTLRRTAAQICGNANAYDTANHEINPYAGITDYIVSAKLDTTGWVLVAASENVKPLILAMREQPSLQSAWFDPKGADGGMHYFKYYARYNIFYGDWRTAIMGNS